MSWLFVSVLLLLAIALWFAATLIFAAHRRATHRVSFEEASTAFDCSPHVSQEVAVEEALELPQPSPIAHRDAYADPIDGVPFLLAEHPVPCPCGVAYRAESLGWLAVHCGGRCVQCGSPIEAGQSSQKSEPLLLSGA